MFKNNKQAAATKTKCKTTACCIKWAGLCLFAEQIKWKYEYEEEDKFLCHQPSTSPSTAHLNRYTATFSWVAQKSTWCQRFGVLVLQNLKVRKPRFGHQKKPDFLYYLPVNQNGQFSPKVCWHFLNPTHVMINLRLFGNRKNLLWSSRFLLHYGTELKP